MLYQVDGALLHAMSGIELSRISNNVGPVKLFLSRLYL